MARKLINSWLAGMASLALIPTSFCSHRRPHPIPKPPRLSPQSARSALAAGESRDFPAPRMVEGLPFETRPPEKADDKPLFPQQTRAPYHKVADYAVTTITNKLRLPWCIAFLPDGRFLVTEKENPGALRIVDQDGTISAPLTGLTMLAAPGRTGIARCGARSPLRQHQARLLHVFRTTAGRLQQHQCRSSRAGSVGRRPARRHRDLPRHSRSTGQQFLHEARRAHCLCQGSGVCSCRSAIATKVRPGWSRNRPTTISARSFTSRRTACPPPTILSCTSPACCLRSGPSARAARRASPSIPGPAISGKSSMDRAAAIVFDLIEPGKNYGWPIITHGIDYPGVPIGEGITTREGLEQPVYYWDPVIAPRGWPFTTASCFRSGQAASSSAACAAGCWIGLNSSTTESWRKSPSSPNFAAASAMCGWDRTALSMCSPNQTGS